MSSNTPFQGNNVLSTRYSSADAGGADGDHKTTVPGNFQKVRDEVLNLHTRLCQVEGAVGVGSVSERLEAECNGHFAVQRRGPKLFEDAAGFSPGGQIVRDNESGFLASTAYAAAALAGGGSAFAEYDYIPSLFPGWFMAEQFFTNIGEVEDVQGGYNGAKFTVSGSATHSFDETQISDFVGDLPGIYQILSAHWPIEVFQNREMTIRLRYSHSGNIPDNTSYRIYIAYINASGERVTSLGTSLQTTAGSNYLDVSHSTTNDVTAFPNGVIPSDALAVEMGFVCDSFEGSPGFSTDPWIFHHFIADVGGVRPSIMPVNRAIEEKACERYYAQSWAGDVTGVEWTSVSMLQDLGYLAAPSPVTTPGTELIRDYPLTLRTPWQRATADFQTVCRFQDLIGCIADGRIATKPLDSATDTYSIDATNPRSAEDATEPPNMIGTTTHLRRRVTAQPTDANSAIYDLFDIPVLEWSGEIVATYAPLMF